MSTLTLNQTELLTQQGMAALQTNDKARAYDLLGRAIQLAPHNEQAWLWLSGAVESAAERRYCLEQVLMINPHNAAAQRGMALLPPTLPISPFKEAAPEPVVPMPAPEASILERAVAAPASTPAASPASLLDIVAQPDSLSVSAPLAAAALTAGSARAAQPPSLLDIIAQPDQPARPISADAPTVVTYMPPVGAPQPTPQPAPAAGAHNQVLADFVVREFGRHRSRDEVIRALSEEHRLPWAEAEALVTQVTHTRRRSIAARQSPFLIFLGVATLIGGCILVGRGIFVLTLLQSEPTLVRSVNPRAVGGIFVQMGVGVTMMLGSLIGLGQTIKGLFK
jgi:hypothetical protein